MSMMLNFQNALWSLARASAEAGRSDSALSTLEPLCEGEAVPLRMRWMSHRLAARLHHNAERYASARRHLAKALKLGLNSHLIRFEYGMAYEIDPYGCDHRAARHFQIAVRLNPRNAKYRAVYGRALVRCGKIDGGIKQVRIALKLDPKNIEVIRISVEALNAAGRRKAANRLAGRAIFLAPGDQGLRRLLEQTRFAAAAQSRQKFRKVHSDSAPQAVLRFIRLEREEGSVSLIRKDSGSRPAPHITRIDFTRARRG